VATASRVTLEEVFKGLEELARDDADRARIKGFRESVCRMVEVPFHDGLDVDLPTPVAENEEEEEEG
jgi:hypothetical protein